jgi:hypothetical protein
VKLLTIKSQKSWIISAAAYILFCSGLDEVVGPLAMPLLAYWIALRSVLLYSSMSMWSDEVAVCVRFPLGIVGNMARLGGTVLCMTVCCEQVRCRLVVDQQRTSCA